MPSHSQSAYQAVRAHAPLPGMQPFPDASSLQSGFTAQLNMFNDLTSVSWGAMRRLSELHVQFAQQAMQDAANATRLLLACSDPLQLAVAAAGVGPPACQRWQAYQHQLARLFSGVQAVMSAPGAVAPEPRLGGGESLTPPPAILAETPAMRGNGAFHAGASGPASPTSPASHVTH